MSVEESIACLSSFPQNQLEAILGVHTHWESLEPFLEHSRRRGRKQETEGHWWGSRAHRWGTTWTPVGAACHRRESLLPKPPNGPYHVCGGHTPTTITVYVDVSAPKSQRNKPNLERAQRVSSNAESTREERSANFQGRN